MENRCCVLGCLMTSDDGVRLHEFPFDDKMLLPIWIMATNRSNWLPLVQSRICDNHFCDEDFEDGDRSNTLNPHACPIIHLENGMTNNKTFGDSEDSELLSTSDFHCSDINSSDLLDTPNTSDMKSSDDDSSLSSCSNFSNSNEATGFDDDFLSSLSSSESDVENKDAEESVLEFDSLSSSSSVTSFTNQPVNHECAVVLCNEDVRNQFDKIFFINFPTDNKSLCDMWWKICMREGKFDPSFKICSIHFESEDFRSITIRRNGQLFKQTVLKNNSIVPTYYLLAHEYTKFARKRKRSMNDSYKANVQKNSTESEFCIIEGCDKTFNKPTVADRICSDHFENGDVLMIDNVYDLNNDAIPSIKPQDPFVTSSEDNHDITDITRENNYECTWLNSLENKLDDQEPQNHQNILNTSTTQSISTKLNDNKKKNMIPKSRNNENDCEYIYLDMLDGDDAKNLLSFEKKSIPKNSKTKILKVLEKSQTNGIPESIIYNQHLIECYGEMLLPYCDQDCQLTCRNSMSGPERRQIYKDFQLLNNATEQNCKITQLVQLNMTKKRDGTFESCPTYHFIRNKESVKVCRTFFTNTLGIPDHRLEAVLKPINYSWYSDRNTALKANQPKQDNEISEPAVMTDFIKKSLIPLDKDYNLYEPESDPEVSLENVPFKEYEKVFLFMKGIPRVLSSYKTPETLKKHFFETSICLEYMYKTYSENFIRNKTPPPYTKCQFKKLYNEYMKTFLKKF